MKRLALKDFAQKQNKKDQKNAQQLLGQVLGDCHDQKDDGGLSPGELSH